jgi:hypothetical protein
MSAAKPVVAGPAVVSERRLLKILKWLSISALAVALLAGGAQARVTNLEILRRKPILADKPFGAAGGSTAGEGPLPSA